MQTSPTALSQFPPFPAINCACHETCVGEQEDHSALLDSILTQRSLMAFFQPIIEFSGGRVFGYEGLIRGPINTPLHAPIHLFKAAEALGRLAELERLCRYVVLESFVAQRLPGRLFLNVSPACLLAPDFREGETLRLLRRLELNPSRVIIELTENKPIFDYNLLREAARHYRGMGFEIAIDDLGEGFSSLRLWSELRPEFVKIDMHFIQGINHDPVKLQFVRSIQVIAECMGARVIAEGIETPAELNVLKTIGLALGQGFHIARPDPAPPLQAPEEVVTALRQNGIAVYPVGQTNSNTVTARKLLKSVPVASPLMTADEVFSIFSQDNDLNVLPVVSHGAPLGLINRYRFVDHYARPYQRELHGSKPCTRFMDNQPLMVDQAISLSQLSRMIADGSQRHVADGFIITGQGNYLGIGNSQDLIREITEQQIQSARHANPLTQLPGNVPINEHIERLLHNRSHFVMCYFDLDHFKPFNDRYGFRRGDDIILLCARILSEASDPERDFLGHVGGDDFVLLFQSEDWERRCRLILARFDQEVETLFDPQDLKTRGFEGEDRQGNALFFPLTSLSIGAVSVAPGGYRSHYEVAAAAGEAKKQAKSLSGSSLFIERRSPNAAKPRSTSFAMANTGECN
ncbi:MAG: GGDEF domain-containing protein [Sulfuricella denitrificans]|nr:GGDEF domain-containing protein [Sulfuricella denitrificans]